MKKLLILYASLTGMTQSVAYALHAALRKEFSAWQIDIINARELQTQELAGYPLIIFGAPTWDDGINTADAHNLLVRIAAEKPDLTNVRFALFGLGDSMYMHFCTALDLIRPVLLERGAKVFPEPFTIDGYPTDELIADAVAWASAVVKEFAADA